MLLVDLCKTIWHHYRQPSAVRRARAERLKNEGNVLRRQGRPEEALAAYRRALTLLPDYAEAANNIALVLNELGYRTESLIGYRHALAIDPSLRASIWNYANVLLSEGDFVQGWAWYEKRLDPAFCGDPDDIRTTLAQFGQIAHWRGEPLVGKKILIWTEQGLGDNLMMMRYLPLFAARFGSVPDIWCEPALARVIATLPSIGQVYSKTQTLTAHYDYHCAMLSLPWHFKSTLDTLPRQIPYLQISEHWQTPWRQRCAGLSGKKIGLVWSGVSLAQFTVSLTQLSPLFAQPNIHWISLQKGEAAAQLRTIRVPIIDWMDDCHDFADTAALMMQVDLVISIDTAVAHLAGALGKPLWLLLRLNSDWRWCAGECSSPWYSDVRIFRQKRYGDWESVVDEVAAALV